MQSIYNTGNINSIFIEDKNPVCMITITKTYDKYRAQLDGLVQSCLAHKLTFFGFFYASDLEHTKTRFKFENNIKQGTRRQSTIQRCVEMLQEWDGIMKYTVAFRTKDEKLYTAVQYFNSCPLSHIEVKLDDKILLSRDVNLTIVLIDMLTPCLKKDFVLKRKNTHHFYLEETFNGEGSGLYYAEFHFRIKDHAYGLFNMSHYMEHQVFKYCAVHTLTGNAMTDTFLSVQFYFTIEPSMLSRFLDDVQRVLTQPFEEKWDDFMEALRVSIETTREVKKEVNRNAPLSLAFAKNEDLIDNPDIHYISWLFHNNYELHKCVLEYSGKKYNNAQLVDRFMGLKLKTTDDPTPASPPMKKLTKQFTKQKVKRAPLKKVDPKALYLSQFLHFSYLSTHDDLIYLSKGIPVPDAEEIPKKARFMPFQWFPREMISQSFVRRLNKIL